MRGLFARRDRGSRARQPAGAFRFAADSGGIIPSTSGSRFLAHGTTNPWGHDWNALGEAFFINTVNGHLWHVIAGAHFARPHSIEPNPRAYAIIDQHADHYHWDNSQEYKKFLVPGSIDDRRGGGHAHSGVMIYLADQWPAPYRDKLLTLNFHGRRVNVERLERSGSGYVGRHEPDIFFAADPWFRGIDLSYGPDGSVFVRRLERYRRVPRARRRPPFLGPDLPVDVTVSPVASTSTTCRLLGETRSRRAAPPSERVVRPQGEARSGGAIDPGRAAARSARRACVRSSTTTRPCRGRSAPCVRCS